MPSFFDPSFGMNNPFYTEVSLYTIVFIKKKTRVTSSPFFLLNCPHLFHPPPFTGNPVDVIIPRHVNKVRHGFSSTDGRMEIHPCVLLDIGPLGPLPKNKTKQVAQGQYIVSNTRCPALHDRELK